MAADVLAREVNGAETVAPRCAMHGAGLGVERLDPRQLLQCGAYRLRRDWRAWRNRAAGRWKMREIFQAAKAASRAAGHGARAREMRAQAIAGERNLEPHAPR